MPERPASKNGPQSGTQDKKTDAPFWDVSVFLSGRGTKATPAGRFFGSTDAAFGARPHPYRTRRAVSRNTRNATCRGAAAGAAAARGERADGRTGLWAARRDRRREANRNAAEQTTAQPPSVCASVLPLWEQSPSPAIRARCTGMAVFHTGQRWGSNKK